METGTVVLLAVAAGVVGLVIYGNEKSAAAATPSSALPATATVTLTPGGNIAANVAPGGSVVLVLPTGASWTTTGTPVSPIPTTSAQPSGNQSFNVVMSSAVGQYPLTASWVDSTGTAQTTQIAVGVA